MGRFQTFLKFFAAIVFGLLSTALKGQDFQEGPVDADQAIAELVADVAAIRPGQSFDVALRLELDPHWHAYWKNPGDAGLAPKIEWVLPEGFVAGELEFSPPERIITPPDFMSYGYEGEVFFLTKVTAPQNLASGQTVTLQAKTSWLACEKMCIPGKANLALKLPVGEASAASQWAEKLAATRSGMAKEAQGSTLRFEALEKTVSVELQWPGLEGVNPEKLYFYVEEEGLINSAAPQTFAIEGTSLIVALEKSPYFEGEVARLSGILSSEEGFAALGGVKDIYVDSAKASAAEGMTTSESGSEGLGFAQALLFAFVGGLILNLMPCVFPVLSIKILGFVQQSGEDPGKIKAHGLAFTAGVLVSFWLLAGVLIALRAGGESLGWGFQLQSPYFVGALLLIMFLFGLSLAGVFEMGASAIGLAGKVKGEGYGGSLFSGVLATAVATPCTAPFMGSALGFALTLSAMQSMTIFSALALGMAAPYLVLSFNPKLIDTLPRPGAWMETFKQVMSFPMFATCIWLVWLMGAHVGNDGLVMVLGGLLVVAIGAWVYGRWATPVRSAGTRRLAIAIALLFGLGGLWMLMPSEAATASASGEEGAGPDRYGVTWEPFSPEAVAEARAAGKPVFIDFTAKWCLTCKANKAVVFSSDEVVQRFESLGVVMMIADWTKRDPVITEALESFGRSGVPLYVLYDGRPASDAQVLPELLNPGIVLDALDKVTPAPLAVR